MKYEDNISRAINNKDSIYSFIGSSGILVRWHDGFRVTRSNPLLRKAQQCGKHLHGAV